MDLNELTIGPVSPIVVPGEYNYKRCKMLTLDDYLQTASSMLGRSVTQWEGLGLLIIGVAISALLLNMVSSSLSEGRAEAVPSILISILILSSSPLFYRAFSSESVGFSELMSGRALMTLSLCSSALILGACLAAKWFKMSLLSGIMSVIPFTIFWILLIILLNQFGDALHSGEERMESIRGRTVELHELMGD